MSSDANTCLGLLGKIFGHKFTKRDKFDWHESNYCYRCGKQKQWNGTWPSDG